MDEHTLALLEFPRVIEQLAGLCTSPQGRALLAREPILTDPAEVGAAHALALGMRAILESGEPVPGLDFPDLQDVLPRLGKPGLQMEGEELAAVGRFVASALALRGHVRKLSAHAPLTALAGAVPDLDALPRAIFRVVDREGALRERHLPELAAIRERIRRGRDDVERSVKAILDEQSSRGWWQGTLPTQRDGRFVLPLKTQFRGRVKGIVHEMSASGSTVFIEPLEIVEKNNAVVQEEGAYRQEVRRILRELTSTVSALAGELRALVDGTARLDTIMARARYAIEHRCYPADADPGGVELREARHPLLGPGVVLSLIHI